MSRIGRKPIAIPAGVEVSVDAANVVTVKGPKGTLSQKINPVISVEINGAEVCYFLSPATHFLNKFLLEYNCSTVLC